MMLMIFSAQTLKSKGLTADRMRSVLFYDSSIVRNKLFHTHTLTCLSSVAMEQPEPQPFILRAHPTSTPSILCPSGDVCSNSIGRFQHFRVFLKQNALVAHGQTLKFVTFSISLRFCDPTCDQPARLCVLRERSLHVANCAEDCAERQLHYN